MGKVVIKTDLQIAIPTGCYGRIAPRSGLAVHKFIDIGGGVIDKDFRGNVSVVLFNFGNEAFTIERGDRVAQLICEKIAYPPLIEVTSFTETNRGVNGLGSTGINMRCALLGGRTEVFEDAA